MYTVFAYACMPVCHILVQCLRVTVVFSIERSMDNIYMNLCEGICYTTYIELLIGQTITKIL